MTLAIARVFTLIEPGPVVLVTTSDGAWNHSYNSLRDSGECVIAVPTLELIDQVVGIGTCSGADTDKFAKFGLTPLNGKHVKAPLIKECLANIECKVVDIIAEHNIVILQGLAAYLDSSRRERHIRRGRHQIGPAGDDAVQTPRRRLTATL